MTRPVLTCAATAAALAAARARTSSRGVGAVMALSSTPLTITSGRSPADWRSWSRAGDADARMMFVTAAELTDPALSRGDLISPDL